MTKVYCPKSLKTVKLFLFVVVTIFVLRSSPQVRCQSSEASKPRTVVARIGGVDIFEEELTSLIRPQLTQIQNQEYEIKRQAIERIVQDKLLELRAREKGTTKEALLSQEVHSKVLEPTENEIIAFYLAQKDRLKRTLDEVRPQLKTALKAAKTEEARQQFVSSLRANYKLSVLLPRPRVEIGFDISRVRGNPSAPITIVEFSDFQCPYCQKTQGILKELLAKYSGQVKLAFRDFPLDQLHPAAQMGAAAARCAGEQGKYWEYHDMLFEQPAKINPRGLVEMARTLKLDDKLFAGCLQSNRFKGAIEQDIRDGMNAGVSGTPTFFINGIPVTGLQLASTFEKVIEEELMSKSKSGGSP